MKGNDGNWVRTIRGPITLITLGGLFALNNFDNRYGFEKTWPVLLIVFGVLSLLRRSVDPPAPAAPPPQAPPPNYNWVPPVPPSGSYSGSPYSQPTPPPAPSKGGFGASAPPREPEPTTNPPSGEPI
jgi:hypothetical protein